MTIDQNDPGRRDKDFLQQMTKQQRKDWVKAILHRMMDAWKVYNYVALANKVGCHKKLPSNWIQAGKVPWYVIYTCHNDTGTSLDWLYNGTLAGTITTPDIEQQLFTQAHEQLNNWLKMEHLLEVSPISSKTIAKSIVESMITQLQPQHAPD